MSCADAWVNMGFEEVFEFSLAFDAEGVVSFQEGQWSSWIRMPKTMPNVNMTAKSKSLQNKLRSFFAVV